ncbi:hypothetical protein D3C78_1963300 [compost metagenome]
MPEGGFGGYSAAPVARKIFDAYDQEYGLDGIPKKNAQKNIQSSESDGTNTSGSADTD